MTGPGPVLLSATVTLCLAAAAVITLGASAGRSQEVARSLGAGGESQGRGPVLVLLSLLRRLPLSRPLRRRISAAGLGWDEALVELALVAGIAVTYVGTRPLMGRIAGGVLAAAVPLIFFRWLQRRAARRAEQFIAQLPEVSRVLSNGTSAGMSVERSLGLAAREVPVPASTELGRVVSEIALGRTLDDALGNLARRMPSRELDVLVRTVVIQSKSGGALVSALQDIALALEERKQLHREVRTAILGSAIGGYIVPVLGVGSVVFLNLMEPGILDDMASTLIGRVILGGALVFFGLGALLMRLVSRVEV
ncbi:type II secretion system F family protein [Actinomyces wuliandei]|uniref:type II secretion system F family protein n=1 Tax=Actinomyces wuliandei TaxID=2057743 RepID=UPI000FD6E82C|nr:type II secretion system F family protein [Actinomyces wuliandei]